MRFRVLILDWRALSRDEFWAVSVQGAETANVLRDVIARGAFKSYGVEAADAEEVFAILNRVPGFEHRVPASYCRERSLSVGDIIIDAAGVAQLCASIGWKRLSEAAPEAAALLAAGGMP